MLQGVDSTDSLQGLARAKSRSYETKTVNSKLVGDYLSKGWTIDRKNKATTRVRRDKPHGQLLEDRVWSLLYKMRFGFLSGKTGAVLELPGEDSAPTTKIDVVGMDGEIALAVECKSSDKPARRPTFQEELGKHRLIRENFAQSIRKQFPTDFRRQVVLAMFTSNILLSENDRTRAKQANVVVLDERDLAYYETLVNHLGSAAKYQFFSDLMPGKDVPGLRIRVPAIRHKMGGTHCYTLAASPEYLLKICYVSHRSKGKASDVDAYQRMVQKSRLNKIRKYISENGYFPTSIVINLDSNRVRFERVKQEDDSAEHGLLGWLEIRPAYKSAWVIDGQHRLFGYSGQDRAPKSRLTVLAFAGLRPSEQARLFIEINSKQKRVSQILLQTLIAELNWDADDPRVRLGAIISKVVQELDADPESPFYHRIQTSDDSKDAIRCITITSLHSAIEKTKLHIVKEKQGNVVEYGPLWGGDNRGTLDRTARVLNQWFKIIAGAAPDWWEKGANPGGGLAMNDGVSACVAVLRSVFEHLDQQGKKLLHFDADDLFELTRKYGVALADYLGALSEEERQKFRELRGIQGITARTRRCQKAIRDRYPEFNPEGLERYLEEEKAQTNTRSKEIIDRIETTLQKVILEELKREFGEDESEWWIEGVPKTVRVEVGKRYEDDDGKRGSKEHYFDLIHYRKIATDHWDIFKDLLGFGKPGASKERATAWMNELNEKRKIVSHASSAISLSLEDLTQLQEYETTLMSKISGRAAQSARLSGEEPEV
jgi:DNA sulfur modification protein DndB